MNATIKTIGMYVPERKISNAYFEKILDTSDEWITSRTGIQNRYFSEAKECTSHLCIRAVENLTENYSLDISTIDFIIVATSTPDQSFPSVASRVQDYFKIENAGCMDLSAACAGFVYGITLAKGLIAANTHKKVLVIGAETLSKICDFSDRTSCILFGDGAGAVVVESSEKNHLFAPITTTDGSYGKELYKTSLPIMLNGEYIKNDGKIHQNGRVVFKWAVNALVKNITKLCIINNVALNELNWLIPHSANIRILEAVCSELDFPIHKCLESVKEYGNTSAASIPIAWYNGLKNGNINCGDKLLLAGFGGGLTFSGIYIANQIAMQP
ncbi:beta-ketoacyl-ACP synthase 3 [Sinomicrobium sp. M5D2P17]